MFTKLKQAFNRAITSLDTHSEIVRAQTQAVNLQAEVLRALIASIAAVEQQVKYLADSERRELQRRGHPNDF